MDLKGILHQHIQAIYVLIPLSETHISYSLEVAQYMFDTILMSLGWSGTVPG